MEHISTIRQSINARKLFLEAKLKCFIDSSYNYNKFPMDIKSDSILERYKKIN